MDFQTIARERWPRVSPSVASWANMGASEVTLKKSTYELTVTLKHSKEA
jgi:hypothetical protein